MELKIQNRNLLWGYAFLLIAAAYIAGFSIDLTGDAGLYAAITRQMVESGDWFNLKINGEPYDQKPHLLFWLAGAGVRLFGNVNFAFKLFPVLYGWLSFYFTYRLGKTLYGETTGKIAALFAVTSQIFFLYSFDIHTDIVLQTGVVLALWQLAEYLKLKRHANFIFGFVGIGLAMLAKGPVGAVIPFFSVLFYLLIQKDFKQLFHLKWLLGVAISLIVVSPSLIHLYKSFGWQGIEFYFITNNFGRISGEYAGSSNDPFFYVYNAIWMFLPWTVIVFFAVYKEIKTWFAGNPSIWGIYLIGSVLVYFAIISFARGKAPNYFMIAAPSVFVIAAKWINRWCLNLSEQKSKLLPLQWIFLALVSIFLVVALTFYSESSMMWFTPVVLSSFIALFFALKKISKPVMKVTYVSLIFIGLFNFYLNIALVPKLAEYQGARQALEIFERNQKKGDQLYNFALEEYELFFMAEDSVENIVIARNLYDLLESDNTWVYTNEIKYKDIIRNFENEIDTIYTIQQRGMNELNLRFMNPKKRAEYLNTNYLIKAN